MLSEFAPAQVVSAFSPCEARGKQYSTARCLSVANLNFSIVRVMSHLMAHRRL